MLLVHFTKDQQTVCKIWREGAWSLICAYGVIFFAHREMDFSHSHFEWRWMETIFRRQHLVIGDCRKFTLPDRKCLFSTNVTFTCIDAQPPIFCGRRQGVCLIHTQVCVDTPLTLSFQRTWATFFLMTIKIMVSLLEIVKQLNS